MLKEKFYAPDEHIIDVHHRSSKFIFKIMKGKVKILADKFNVIDKKSLNKGERYILKK